MGVQCRAGLHGRFCDCAWPLIALPSGALWLEHPNLPARLLCRLPAVGGNLTVARDTLLGTAPASVVIVSGTAQLAAATVLGALKAGAANLSSATVGGLETTALTARTVNVTGAAHRELRGSGRGMPVCPAAVLSSA